MRGNLKENQGGPRSVMDKIAKKGETVRFFLSTRFFANEMGRSSVAMEAAEWFGSKNARNWIPL